MRPEKVSARLSVMTVGYIRKAVRLLDPRTRQFLSGSCKRQALFCLTYSDIRIYYDAMARAATNSDAFNAVAEPRRRDILMFLAEQERPVSDIVAALEMEQPSVSKHLRVLREVRLVRMRRDGRRKLYRTNAAAIRPLHEWAGEFERFWRHTLSRVKERAEARMAEAGGKGRDSPS